MFAPLSFGAPFEIRDDFEQSLPEDENLNQSPLVILMNSKAQYWILFLVRILKTHHASTIIRLFTKKYATTHKVLI